MNINEYKNAEYWQKLRNNKKNSNKLASITIVGMFALFPFLYNLACLLE